MRKKIRERFMNKKIFNRIYLEGKDFEGTVLKIGDKLNYHIDPTTRIVRISLNEEYDRQVTVSYRKPKLSQRKENDTRLFPVVDIGNKDVLKNFGDCTCAKFIIYEDGFELIPWDKPVDSSVDTVTVESTSSTFKRILRGFTQLREEQQSVALRCADSSPMLTFKTPSEDISSSRKRREKKPSKNQLSLFDIGFTLADDEQTQALSKTDEFKKEHPILAKTLKVFSLFSGIGAFEMALRNLGINHTLLHYCEIDKHASKSYAAIHNVSEEMNLGDITQVNLTQLPQEVDLLTHGSPCQDFSTAGKGLGGDEGSHTRSSLMWNAVEFIRRCLPRFVVWENVKGVLSKKNKHNYEKYLNELENLGYKNHTLILNAKDFGLPQNRERLFVVSTKGESTFEEPNSFPSDTRIEDVLENEIEDNRYVKKDYNCLESVDLSYSERLIHKVAYVPYVKNPEKVHQSNTIYHPKGISPAVYRDHEKQPLMVLEANSDELANPYRIRRLSALEHWRLMGFSDDDYLKASNFCSKTQIYRQVGNSIALPVIECIFYKLFKGTEFLIGKMTSNIKSMLSYSKKNQPSFN